MPEPIEFQRVLVVTAHPDDVDFAAAGTIASWTDAGIDVAYCIVTDGDAGGFDPETPRADIAGIRQREQTEAAAAVGVTNLRFLGYPDGLLEPSLQLRKDISREIRRFRPDIVLTQSPTRNLNRIYASHPDHLAAAEATVCAVYPDARNPYVFTDLIDEGFEAHTVRQIWIMGSTESNHAVDTTNTFARKITALLCHKSQHANPEAMCARVRAWNEQNATESGLQSPAGSGDRDPHTAELFLLVDTA